MGAWELLHFPNILMNILNENEFTVFNFCKTVKINKFKSKEERQRSGIDLPHLLMGRERERWLLCLICLPGVSWWLSGSSSQCHRVVCSLWLWYFLIILTYYWAKIWQKGPSGNKSPKWDIYRKRKSWLLWTITENLKRLSLKIGKIWAFELVLIMRFKHDVT